jgi:hypothetical protein
MADLVESPGLHNLHYRIVLSKGAIRVELEYVEKDQDP